MDLLKGTCPKCGEVLEIPAHLKQFSCLYCGARLSPADLKQEMAPTEANVDGASAYQYYVDHVVNAVTGHRGIEEKLNKSDFDPAFQRYSAMNAETFRRLDEAVAAGAATVEEAADCFLDGLEEAWRRETKKSSGKFAVGQVDRDKFIIAIYLVPMVRRMGLSSSEDFCLALQASWCRRHPKSPFHLGDYDTIMNGFRKKYFGLCFITTAVCRYSGKADDCAELTAFRTFRDGYLRACPDGAALIDEYYDLAPGIVLRLDMAEDRDRRYEILRQDYLLPCYQDILAGRLEQCKERYTNMMHELKEAYLQ